MSSVPLRPAPVMPLLASMTIPSFSMTPPRSSASVASVLAVA